MIEALADEDLTNPNEYMDSTIWHHVVFSVKPLEYIKLFIENELQDTTGIDNNVNDFCESPIILGKYFKGHVDDVIIYQKALDEMEVDTIFNLPSSCDQNALNLQEIKTIENGIEVFPNPSKNILNINSSVTYNQFLLTNTMGQHIYTGSLNQNLNQIDVSHIPNGMYYLTIDSDKNNTIKVIVNH